MAARLASTNQFFYKLVDCSLETMGDVFPEIRAKKISTCRKSIQHEEEAFNKTLDRGIELFMRFEPTSNKLYRADVISIFYGMAI